MAIQGPYFLGALNMLNSRNEQCSPIPRRRAEYATNAAMLVVSYFADDLLTYYDENFIQTKKDRRKTMMLDYRDAYREVIQDCQIHINAHGFLLKELASAQRALNKVMKELCRVSNDSWALVNVDIIDNTQENEKIIP